MTIYDVCDFMLFEASDAYYDTKTPLMIPEHMKITYVDSGIKEDEIKEAAKILVHDKYFERSLNNPDLIRITGKGKIFRKLGAYKVSREEERQEKDRQLQRAVSQSVIDTNSMQRLVTWIIGGTSVISLVVAILAFFKEDVRELRLQPPIMLIDKHQNYILPQSLNGDKILIDSTEVVLGE